MEHLDDDRNKKASAPYYSVGYLYCKDADLAYTACNHHYAVLLGAASSDEVIGKKDTDFEYSLREFGEDESLVLTTQKSHSKVYKILSKYIHIDRTPLWDKQGALVGIQAIGFDVTHYQLEIERSHEERAFVEDVLYDLPGLIFWKNKQSEYLGFNRNIVELSGLTRDTLKGKTDGGLIWGSKESATFVEEDQEVIKTGIVKVVEHQIPVQRLDGTNIVVRVEKSPLFDRHGNVIGVLAVGLDVTDEKILDKQRTQIELEKEKALIFNLEYIISHMPGYIYWKDKKSQYVGCNYNLARISGLAAPSDIIGKTDYDFAWGKEEAERFIMDDKMVMDKKTVRTTEYALPVSREDGRNLVVRTDKMPLYNKNGDVIGVLAIAVDITEQKALEEALIQEKNRVEALSQMKTFFIRNMEHDIRTPFGGIYTIADVLGQQEQDENKKAYLKAIAQSAKELLDYCNNILDFSRLEAGTLPIISKKFNIRALLESVIRIEMPAAKAKQLDLTYSYDEKIPVILVGDPYRVQRILINLVSNAIKFTQKGYVNVVIKMPKIVALGDFVPVVFFIEDTGIGISEDNQNRIYEPLQRITPASKGLYKGTGLGLTIVKQLLEELKGEIEIHSVVGKGATFIFTIPFKRALVSEIFYENNPNIDSSC